MEAIERLQPLDGLVHWLTLIMDSTLTELHVVLVMRNCLRFASKFLWKLEILFCAQAISHYSGGQVFLNTIGVTPFEHNPPLLVQEFPLLQQHCQAFLIHSVSQWLHVSGCLQQPPEFNQFIPCMKVLLWKITYLIEVSSLLGYSYFSNQSAHMPGSPLIMMSTAMSHCTFHLNPFLNMCNPMLL